ncbi:MAG: chemotaxis protein CheD [Deltaproteobacteria bacterium]|nr:chemotaxis protein CheD [Deltaproteobacteria bacterium]
MNTIAADLQVVTVKPGELNISARPVALHTILGSCLTVTMFSPRMHIGGICHALLPHLRRGDPGGGKPAAGAAHDGRDEEFKYVDSAIKFMLESFSAYGVAEDEIEIKTFGGADMFESSGIPGGIVTVGAQNIKMAGEFLESRHLKIVNSDVGGREGRVLYFYTHTGECLVRRIINTGIYRAYLKKLYNNYNRY